MIKKLGPVCGGGLEDSELFDDFDLLDGCAGKRYDGVPG